MRKAGVPFSRGGRAFGAAIDLVHKRRLKSGKMQLVPGPRTRYGSLIVSLDARLFPRLTLALPLLLPPFIRGISIWDTSR